MIQAKHHPLVVAFFKHYTEYIIRKHFNRIIVPNKIDVKDHAVLLVSNHISWWDGFFALHLNTHYFKRKFHFMMHEKELKKRWIFSYTGGFSVNKNTSALDSLRYTSQLLTDRENMVVMYPQGKLHSSHQHEVAFQKGIERIKINPETTKLIFLVQLTDYFQHKKPTAYLYLKEIEENTILTQKIETIYNEFYYVCIKQHNLQSV